jgi:hypothetical protein
MRKTVFPVIDLEWDAMGRICLRRGFVTESVAMWLTEAQTLFDLGMPRESSTLTFNAGWITVRGSYEIVRLSS